ncbi:prephenate dehydrogenase [Pseudolysinimonas kribbensis]
MTTTARTRGPVRIVGAGLLGASIGLALRERGVEVVLADASKSALRLAVDYGAGRPAADDDAPALVVVAVPPEAVAEVVARELDTFPDALVTDVASVKSGILRELSEAGADLARYVGSHPMAGRERGGAVSARADLFLGRPWVIAPHDAVDPERLRAVEDLALDVGAAPRRMRPDEHDHGVALVSHVPQLVASLLAARLVEAPDAEVGLAGQGLRDTTRIAGSNPELWVQILGANAAPVAEILTALRHDLDQVLHALEHPHRIGAPRTVAEALVAGNEGVARIPGKHGQDRRFAAILVTVPDEPGELGRLLTEIGEEGVNMEDLRLEHSPGAQVGFAEIAVLPEAAHRLAAALEGRGWSLVEAKGSDA